MPEVALTTTNATRIVAHNTVVKFNCNLYYEPEGETVRKCIKGIIVPNFHTNPLKCESKLLYLNKLVSAFKKMFYILYVV